jgi:uncharacterized protein YbbC (DUF1343 family)
MNLQSTFCLRAAVVVACVFVGCGVCAAEPQPGVSAVGEYLPLLQGKRIGLVAHRASRVGDTHTLDFLLSKGLNVVTIFAPEHGFRGDADAGATISDETDRTGIPIVSIYNKHKKPSAQHLAQVDVVAFDLQDVGVRCYTYLSTLHYIMEACAENNVPLVLFDRPNPNGHYVDGPVLNTKFRSFVGMHPIPLVHGMTLGEAARMLNGERWLKDGVQCRLHVIKCVSYSHSTTYDVPVPPSPNLPNMLSIYLYPSLCFFEGTVMSVGRGTATAFQVIGHPKWQSKSFEFTPRINSVNTSPLYKNRCCYGVDLTALKPADVYAGRKIDLEYLLDAYGYFGGSLFVKFFDKLAGTDRLRMQIESGLSAVAIREAWSVDIQRFMKVRGKYLLYE